MITKTVQKTSLLALVCLATIECSASVPSLENLVKRSNINAKVMRKEIETNAPDLVQYVDKDPENDALVLLLHKIATSNNPVVIKFYSNYCGPCRTMAPIVEKISNEFESKLLIIEVDTSTFRNMTSIFGFRYIPTLIFFKKGKEIERTNSLPEQQLREKIEALV